MKAPRGAYRADFLLGRERGRETSKGILASYGRALLQQNYENLVAYDKRHREPDPATRAWNRGYNAGFKATLEGY